MPGATLAGVPLVAVRPHGWAQTRGTRPYQRIFETSADGAQRIMAKAGSPVTLEIRGRRPRIVRQLYVISSQPGSRPRTRGVLVADKRIWWQRKPVARSYNLRRRTGEWKLVGEGRIENKVLVPDVAYKPWSLKNGRAWRIKEVLLDLLEALEEKDFELPDELKRTFPVEDLDLDQNGEYAMRRALSYLADYNVYVTDPGAIKIYDVRDRSEVEAIRRAGPPILGTGFSAMSDKRYWRPKKIHVLFERECELRFDYTEGEDDAQSSSVSRSNEKTREERKLENVLRSPDPTLTVAGRELAANSLITVDEAFTAWPSSAHPTPATAPADMSHELMRQFVLGQWEYLVRLFSADLQASDQIWRNRLRRLRDAWRRDFRIIQQWQAKIRSIRAYRVAIVDEKTGARANATAHMDYLVKSSIHGVAKKRSDHHRAGWVNEGYAANLDASKAAPCDVTVKDEDNGYIRVFLVRDPDGEAEELVPGAVDRKDIPSVDLRESYGWWHAVKLKDTFKLAVVLTCVQGAPNNEGRFHKETITPEQAEKALGVPIGQCDGPELTLKVGGGLLTARFAWDDDLADQIDNAFYEGAEYPPKLLVNREHVEAVALGQAARVYSTMLDRMEGSFAVQNNPEINITGAIQQVETLVTQGGHDLTFITLAPEVQPVDLEGILPASILKAIKGIVAP